MYTTGSIKYPVALASVFLWIGFLGAISFMEAWLKFRAPGITVELGLGIGRLVFNALNKIEWVLIVLVIGNIILNGNVQYRLRLTPLIIVLVLLLAQTFWLLPALDLRAELVIKGQELAKSNLHIYYVIMEIMKVSYLFYFGSKLLNHKRISETEF
ncbi:hypothetical protein [Ulvibacter antarcticus]|uniref:DUF4149 domain-containing protein n=1 Tax=Ulvibacter antarcticus TaxID=442714 RepID=A0A3L9YDD7_9FLAO|nr:hypothetical protein [Ulvibacter antarcticus]RMA58716.1 hypothetical protein BXY75_2093 [Ulvibacter antarcticus]